MNVLIRFQIIKGGTVRFIVNGCCDNVSSLRNKCPWKRETGNMIRKEDGDKKKEEEEEGMRKEEVQISYFHLFTSKLIQKSIKVI